MLWASKESLMRRSLLCRLLKMPTSLQTVSGRMSKECPMKAEQLLSQSRSQILTLKP